MSPDAKVEQAVVEARRAGRSFPGIAKDHGKSGPWAWAIVKRLAPDLLGRKSSKATASKGAEARPMPGRAMYDAAIPYKHGDGRTYGCGETVIITHLLDPDADAKADAAMTAHKRTCYAVEKGRRKKDDHETEPHAD